MKNVFLKALRSRDIPTHTFEIQKEKWKWNNLWYHKLASINLVM